MRISKILEDENWRGETKKCIQSPNGANIYYERLNEFALDEESSLRYNRIAKLLQSDVNDCVTFHIDDQNEPDDFIAMTMFIYDAFDSEIVVDKEGNKINDEMIMKMKGGRIFIKHSSAENIEITFNVKILNKFHEQILSI